MRGPIWTPSPQRVAATNLTTFIAEMNCRYGARIADYDGLHAFSVNSPDRFWSGVWDFCGIRGLARGERVVVDPQRMPGARWFPDARLNFAENLLRQSDERPAMIALREDGLRRVVSFRELNDLASILAQAMQEAGVGIGDRVAGYLPNIPEAAAAMLAAASLGAIWTCCAPEYGAGAAVDRIGQVTPKFLIAGDGYLYGGRRFDLLSRVGEILTRVPSIGAAIVVPVLTSQPNLAGLRSTVSLDDALRTYTSEELRHQQLPFDHPAFILFSSGTTGAPKCILHSAGGALIENLKSHVLQFDVKRGDRVYMPCTTGWVVWNIMLMSLGCGATVVLYDGSPFFPHRDQLVRHTAEERVTFVRWAARYVESIAKEGFKPINEHDLGAVRTIMCNGSVFDAEGYRYIYENVKRDVHLISPSGGTDSCGSLLSSNPIGPVWPGEIQAPALGLKVDIFDDRGQSIARQPGELVVTQSFPSMPVGFWQDPDDRRYHEAYFSHFPGVWRHGDWAEITQRTGAIVYGRSDSTLNARGIRVGTAEIYRQIAHIPQIVESVAVAHEWNGESRVVLFLKLRSGETLDEDLANLVREDIRHNLSPRHVPAKIIAVPDIPVTVTGKVSEAAVHNAIHGREIPNRSSLANPQALAFFAPAQRPELQT